MTAVGFEPTPVKTSALNWRLRPLGQAVGCSSVPATQLYADTSYLSRTLHLRVLVCRESLGTLLPVSLCHPPPSRVCTLYSYSLAVTVQQKSLTDPCGYSGVKFSIINSFKWHLISPASRVPILGSTRVSTTTSTLRGLQPADLTGPALKFKQTNLIFQEMLQELSLNQDQFR